MTTKAQPPLPQTIPKTTVLIFRVVTVEEFPCICIKPLPGAPRSENKMTVNNAWAPKLYLSGHVACSCRFVHTLSQSGHKKGHSRKRGWITDRMPTCAVYTNCQYEVHGTSHTAHCLPVQSTVSTWGMQHFSTYPIAFQFNWLKLSMGCTALLSPLTACFSTAWVTHHVLLST